MLLPDAPVTIAENGKTVENVTLIYDLYFIEYEKIENIADEIREALNLTLVRIVEGSHHYELKDSRKL